MRKLKEFAHFIFSFRITTKLQASSFSWRVGIAENIWALALNPTYDKLEIPDLNMVPELKPKFFESSGP